MKFTKSTTQWNVYTKDDGVRMYENNNWSVEYIGGRIIEINGYTHGEYVQITDENKLLFDFPERLPKYVIDTCYSVLNDIVKYDAFTK